MSRWVWFPIYSYMRSVGVSTATKRQENDTQQASFLKISAMEGGLRFRGTIRTDIHAQQLRCWLIVFVWEPVLSYSMILFLI